MPVRIPSSPARYALGRLPAGVLNKTEASYSAHLELRRLAGEVLWYKFEGIRLKLAERTTITIDFTVMVADGTLEMHDVKGFMEEDANAKLKVAASIYPFRFFVVRKVRGQWDITEVKG